MCDEVAYEVATHLMMTKKSHASNDKIFVGFGVVGLVGFGPGPLHYQNMKNVRTMGNVIHSLISNPNIHFSNLYFCLLCL